MRRCLALLLLSSNFDGESPRKLNIYNLISFIRWGGSDSEEVLSSLWLFETNSNILADPEFSEHFAQMLQLKLVVVASPAGECKQNLEEITLSIFGNLSRHQNLASCPSWTFNILTGCSYQLDLDGILQKPSKTGSHPKCPANWVLHLTHFKKYKMTHFKKYKMTHFKKYKTKQTRRKSF